MMVASMVALLVGLKADLSVAKMVYNLAEKMVVK